jgi:DNA-binding LytR/AlgR family response regulator
MAALKLRALIADDELLARERIRTLLAEDPEVEVVGECGDGATAARMIDALSPDLLLLDVQMPELDGLSALAQVPEARRPRAVLLVTAHEEHAIEAFDLQAVDYLLKPFEEGAPAGEGAPAAAAARPARADRRSARAARAPRHPLRRAHHTRALR